MVDDIRKDKIIRIQADKLCEALGTPKGTYIPHETIQKIADTDISNPIIEINGKSFKVSMVIKGLAQTLLKKDQVRK